MPINSDFPGDENCAASDVAVPGWPIDIPTVPNADVASNRVCTRSRPSSQSSTPATRLSARKPINDRKHARAMASSENAPPERHRLSNT